MVSTFICLENQKIKIKEKKYWNYQKNEDKNMHASAENWTRIARVARKKKNVFSIRSIWFEQKLVNKRTKTRLMNQIGTYTYIAYAVVCGIIKRKLLSSTM